MANRRTRLPALCGTAAVICESMVHSMATRLYPCVGFPASISFEKHPFEHLLQLLLTAVRAVRHVLIDSVVGKTGQRTRNVLAIECGNEFFDPMPGLHHMTPFGVGRCPVQGSDLAAAQSFAIGDQNLESVAINPAGLSSCTLWPASGTATHRPFAKRAAKRAAASSQKTSLRPPRTTRQGDASCCAAITISSTLVSSAG